MTEMSPENVRRNRGWVLRRVIDLVLVIAIVKSLWLAFLLLQSEMNPAHHGWDGAIYTAVGRGILNGLTPYIDLFETKPPGMFLMSALSLKLFGNIGLGNFLQGIVEIGLVLVLFLPLLKLPKNFSTWSTWVFFATTFVFGILLMAYTIEQSGHFQSESFGAMFIALYACMTLLSHNRNLWYMLGTAACFAFAIAIKEPFLLVALAVSLLVMRRWKDLIHTYVLPLVIALIFGAVCMLLIGYLKPYLSVYLPEMMGSRAAYFSVPTWYYVFLASYPLKNIAVFSIPLCAVIVTLWLSNLSFTARVWEYPPRKAIALPGFVGAFTALILLLGSIVQNYAGKSDVADSLFFWCAVAVVAFVFVSRYLLRHFLARDDASMILWNSVRYLVVMVLVLYVMGSGGFLKQQFGFGVALYATLFMMFTLHMMEKWESNPHRFAYGAVALIACVGVLLLPTTHIRPALSSRIVADVTLKEFAHSMDALMDSCNYDRYLMVAGAGVPYQFTEHSPFGPGFHRVEFTVPVQWRPSPIPYLLSAYQENVEKAEFAVAPLELSGKIPAKLENYLAEHFTGTPPACAGSGISRPGVQFLYRKH